MLVFSSEEAKAHRTSHVATIFCTLNSENFAGNPSFWMIRLHPAASNSEAEFSTQSRRTLTDWLNLDGVGVRVLARCLSALLFMLGASTNHLTSDIPAHV